jgi:hypothetical protein
VTEEGEVEPAGGDRERFVLERRAAALRARLREIEDRLGRPPVPGAKQEREQGPA